MDKNISREKIENLRRISIEDLLNRKTKKIGSKLTAHCPFHNSEDREEKSPSFIIYPESNSYHCFSCGAHGYGAISFIIDRDKVDFIEAVKKLDPRVEYNLDHERDTPEHYLKSKGLDDENTKQKFGLKITRHKSFPAIQFNIPTGKKFRRFGTKPKYMHSYGAASCIYKSDENNSSIGYITEGEFDSMVLNKFANIPAWSASTGAESRKVFEDNRNIFRNFKKIFLLYDTDKAGKADTLKVANILGVERCFIAECPVKDWSDFFSLGYTKEDFENILRDAIPVGKLVNNIKDDDIFDNVSEKTNISLYRVISNKEFLSLSFPENPWLIQGVIRLKGKVAVAGEGGVGKTKFVYSIIYSVVGGTHWLGKFEVPLPKKVLLIDKENDPSEIQTDMISMGITSPNLYHVLFPPMFQFVNGNKNSDLSEGANKLKQFVLDNKIEVVVLDSFVDFFQGNENDPGDVAKFSAICDEIFPDCCLIFIHHESKPAQNSLKRAPNQRMRGSTHIFNMLNSALSLSVIDSDKPEIILVEHSKVRGGRKLKPFEVEMIIEPNPSHPTETVVTGFRYLGEVQPDLKKRELASIEIMNIAKTHSHEEINTTQYKSMLEKQFGANAIIDGLKMLVKERQLLVRKGEKNSNYYRYNLDKPMMTDVEVDNLIGDLDRESSQYFSNN